MSFKWTALLLTLFYSLNLLGQDSRDSIYTIASKHKIYSKIIEEEREIYIYIPKGFWGLDEEINNLAVTYVLDGESQFLNTVSAIDYLSAAPLGNDRMPRTLVVGIPNTNRDRDLTPYAGILGKDSTSIERTGGGAKFLDFILYELTPYLDSLYSLSDHKSIIGHSLGGLMVFEALLTRRDEFTNYLSIDPGFGFDNESYLRRVIDTLRAANLNNENLFVATANSVPSFLSHTDIENDTSELLQLLTKGNNKFRAIAEAEDWSINYLSKYYSNENHFSVPYLSTYEAMKFFYDYYHFGEMIDYLHPAYAGKTDLVSKLKAHYKSISLKMGHKVSPMEGFLNSWAFGLAHYNREDLAIQLLKYSIELYPSNTSGYNTLGTFMRDIGKYKEASDAFEGSLKLMYDENIAKSLKDIKDRRGVD